MASPDPSYLGLDFGTSALRACLIDAGQDIIVQDREPLPAPERRDNRIRQSATLWWLALERLLDRLHSHPACRQLQAIAVDGTAGSLLLSEADGTPLDDAWMYNDSSAIDQLDRLRELAPAGHVCLSASSSLAKLMAQTLLDSQQQARYALHQSDWIAGRLAGHYGFSDENNALKLGYDPQARRWPDWVGRLVNPVLLPEVQPPGTPVAGLSADLAGRWRLPADTRIVTGTTDSTASVIATGIREPGEAVTVLGSTLVIKVLSERPVNDSRYGVYSHRLGDLWLAGGASNTGGAVLTRFFSLEQLSAMTPQLDPQHPTGLDYYPLPGTGERFPVNDPRLEPRLSPRPADDVTFFQGLLEGMARIEHQGYRLLHALGAPYPKRVCTAGGGANNAAWMEIRRTLLGVPVTIAAHQEAAYGSALLALKGLSGKSSQTP